MICLFPRPNKKTQILFFLILWWGLFGIASCGSDTSKTPKPAVVPDSQKKMLDIMAEVKRKMNKSGNMFCVEAKLAHCDSLIAATTDPTQQLNLAFEKSTILLEYGDEAQAVSLMENIMKVIQGSNNPQAAVLMSMGLAYVRLAERTNCVGNHSAESCIMPIRGTGVYSDKTPARKAIETFEALLKLEPKNYDALWLLNIAYMTVGEYPDKVPAAWLIPGLDKEGPTTVKPFTDIAGDLHLAVNNRSGGVIVDDFNNDGYLDIVTSAWGLDDPMHYFQNNGDGTFSDLSKASGLSSIMGGLNILQADYNNDGYTDVFVLRGAWQGLNGFGEQPNSLLRNNGNGTFTDVTTDAGLLSFNPTQTGTWSDFNHDGWLDLFIGNESSDKNNLHPCELYINNQDGTFINAAKDANLNVKAFVKGVTAGDYDNDGWPDLFISCLSGEKMLFHNTATPGKKPVFENVSEKSGFAKENAQTFSTAFFDYDNDGWLDLYVCNYQFEGALSSYFAKESLHPSADMAGKVYIYHNNHDGTFTNMSPHMHMNQPVFAMGSNFGDIDNDGYLDLYFATGNPSYKSLIPNKMYKNINGKDFADVTVSARVGNLQKGHAVAFADLNNNGDQDIYVDMGGAFRGDVYPASLYLNPGQNTNNWICIKLEGDRSNRSAIGTKITVKFTENGKKRMVYREVNSGGSFGCSPLRREIGIGQAAEIDEITINWPVSRIVQTLKNVKPNQFIKVKEGKDGFEQVNLKVLTFRRSDGTIPMCAPAR